jgi:ABC-type amino acid transport substrate-binding protein
MSCDSKAAGLLAGLIAVWLSVGPAAAATLDRIRDNGVFRIGYRADARPYSYRDNQGQPAGYIVELCLEVAAALGPNVRREFVLVPADKRFESVRDGAVDILCDPSSVTLPRREMVDFSLPTFLDGASVLYRVNRPVRTFEDFAGKRIGVLTGTTTERVLVDSLRQLNLTATLVPVRSHIDGMDLLSDGKVDAYFADRAIVAAMLREGNRPGFELSRQYFSYETYALALPRDDGAFRLFVDRVLARLYRTGRINAIFARTFGRPPADEMLKTMFLINALPDR